MPVLDVGPCVSLVDANVDRVTTVADRLLSGCVSLCGTQETCRDAIVVAALNTLPTHYYVDASRQDQVGSAWILVETAVAEAREVRCPQPVRRRSW